MAAHSIVMSKMKKAAPMLADPFLCRHVPETYIYDPVNFKVMLAKYNTIYLKPDSGSQGRGIIRLDKLSAGNWSLRHNGSHDIAAAQYLAATLKPIIGARRSYLVQQGIELATYDNCPFDMRLVLLKPQDIWQLTLTSAKVALREDAVVTNVARGARDYPLLDILLNYDQKKDPVAIYKDLIDLVHQGASLLGQRFPLRIIGFDMAVDKDGKIWFLEANTNPQNKQCMLANDSATVQKYQEAREKIGPRRRWQRM